MKVKDILNKITKEDIERAIKSFETDLYSRSVSDKNTLIFNKKKYPVRELIMRASKNELKNAENASSYTVNIAKKRLIDLGFNEFNNEFEEISKSFDNMYFYKIVKKQDVSGEFFIPVKLTRIFDFFPDPRIIDPKPTGDIPSVASLIVSKWINMDGDEDIVIKKYNAKKQTDFRISPTPNIDKSLVENSILKFEKLNENTYNISLIDSSNSDYGDLLKRIIDEGYKKSYLIEGNSIQKTTETKTPKTTSEPLNQIFYGPPGTGKTYTTITTALNIIGIEYKDYADAEEKFRLELGKRIEFVTMHQSYSYEDFIQGLKPYKNEDSTGIIFEYQNGVFKRICERAEESKILTNDGSINKVLTDKLFPSFMLSIDEHQVYEILKKNIFEGKEVPQYVAINFFNNKLGKKYCKAWRDKFDYVLGTQSPRVGYQPDKFREGEMEEFLKYAEEFSKLTKEERKNKLINDWIEEEKETEIKEIIAKKYVIILDEINRANISRVFGELIALIEVNKRDGKLTATLPSGELFSVPSNLYVIGTMNTADKSIALVDIALRRRFKFKALYPNLDILKSVLTDKKMDEQEISNRIEILKRLNKLIRTKKSVDFEIGHSYFMEDDKLENILNSQILPLLNEYFMYDLKAVKNLIENQHIDILGNNIPKTGIIFDKAVYNERGLLEVEKIDFKMDIDEKQNDIVDDSETPNQD